MLRALATALLLAWSPAMAADAAPDLTPRLDTSPLDEALSRAAALRRRPAEPDDGSWNGVDTGLQTAFGLTMLGDYLQTRGITRHGRELNPIIGPRGNRVPPELYFPLVMGAHTLAMRALPQPWRRAAQMLSIGFEGGVVGRNAALGFRF